MADSAAVRSGHDPKKVNYVLIILGYLIIIL